MPGILIGGADASDTPMDHNPSQWKDNSVLITSLQASPTPNSVPSEALNLPVENSVETSIEQLYDNVCDMESSSDGLPSPQSFGSDVDESRIDSELWHLVGGEMGAAEIIEEEVDSRNNAVTTIVNGALDEKSVEDVNNEPRNKSSDSSEKSKRPLGAQIESDTSNRSSLKNKVQSRNNEGTVAMLRVGSSRGKKLKGGSEDSSKVKAENPDVGAFYLKHARDLISSDNPKRALKYALKAAKVFEKCDKGQHKADLVMSLHIVAAIYCTLGHYEQAIPLLERSIEISIPEEGKDNALAKFCGYMQLGDTLAMLGQLEKSLNCYSAGLELQRKTLGDTDSRVGETCRYLAEAYVQALQFDEAERLCQMALDIHKQNGEPSSLEETADRRLMGLICDTKGDYEGALEHLVMASMAMVSNGQEAEVASVDCSIGDAYLSLARYDEAIFAYKKAVALYKATKGENHPSVAFVYIRLADLYSKIGKIRESKTHCENALRIYGKPLPGTSSEEVAAGFTDVSALYESMNENEQALKLLQKALKIYNSNSSGQQSTIAGIEAQMGVLYYVIGNYGESYAAFKNAIAKLRACGERKSTYLGIALNQMGLACAQLYSINEAAELFEEARVVLQQEYGPYHPDTLGVCSNLAGIYDAMGRQNKAIEILEYVVGIREEKLGTANPDVDDEKRRLASLLKETGRVRSRKARSLEHLLDSNPNTAMVKVNVAQ